MRYFMRQPVKQIAYKYCINFAKTEFHAGKKGRVSHVKSVCAKKEKC